MRRSTRKKGPNLIIEMTPNPFHTSQLSAEDLNNFSVQCNYKAYSLMTAGR